MSATETWMPVSGTFRSYPLAIKVSRWDVTVMWSKGHHDPAAYLLAAALEWLEEDGVDVDHNCDWENAEWRPIFPLWVPRSLRLPSRVRHEWWAVRQRSDCDEMPRSGMYWYEPVACTARGAFPVTVIEP